MPRVTNSRLRNFAFMKATPKPDDPDSPSREEWRSMADELLELRRIVDLADLADHFFTLDASGVPQDAVDGAFAVREIDEAGRRLEEAIEAYRKGK